MNAMLDTIGFSHPILRERARKRRSRALAELITAAALVVSLAIAVTAVSIGISRAGTLAAITKVCCVQ